MEGIRLDDKGSKSPEEIEKFIRFLSGEKKILGLHPQKLPPRHRSFITLVV